MHTKEKTFCFDIDGIIMSVVKGNDYSLSKPIVKNVDLINRLYEMGHFIILFTARGTLTGINWEDLTVTQLHKAGVKYHELKFGKPAADFYIDDKMITPDDLIEMVKKQTL